jgi:CTD kinase subunit gamma CTK3
MYCAFNAKFMCCLPQGSTNTRINILYLLDSLCETSLASRSSSSSGGAFYTDYVAKDLGKIVELVVPNGRAGLLNLMSTTQVRPVFNIMSCSGSCHLTHPGVAQLAHQTGHRSINRR